MVNVKDGDSEAIIASKDAVSQNANNSKIKKVKSWASRNHTHIYGMMGAVGLAIAVFTVVNNDTYLEVAPGTKERVERDVAEYRLEHRVGSKSDSSFQKSASEHREYVDRNDMINPLNDDVRILKQNIITGFSGYKDLEPIDFSEPNSAVTQDIAYHIEVMEPTEVFYATATTSGYDVYFSSKSLTKVHASQQTEKVGDYKVKKRIAEFDISDEAEDSKFILEHRKTYWNAFQDKQLWAGYRVDVPTDEVEYLLIFPENKPFRDIEIFATDTDGNRKKLNKEGYFLSDKDKTWLWWRSVNPIPGWTYNIEWEWK